jgi:hypothetical protein
VIVVVLIAAAVVVAGLAVVLAVRDRGRDRSARDVPHREAWDAAGSHGATSYPRHTPGPGA